MKKAKDVSEYLASISPESRATLNQLRKTIKAVAPRATEVISYGIPTFKEGRMLVAYAAFSNHCSFFPLGSSVLNGLQDELAPFDCSKGTIRFPMGKPLPSSLVRKIVKARMKQNDLRELEHTNTKGTTASRLELSLPNGLAKPAQRALAAAKIKNLRQLSRLNESDVRQLHGLGPNAVALLKKAMRSSGLAFASARTTR